MLLSERQIYALVADLILEGYKDDQDYLIEKHPEKEQEISKLGSRWISWLISRFGESPTHTEVRPFEEAFAALVEFAENFQAIASKWKSSGESGENFRQSVDEFLPNRAWKGKDITPAIISSLTVDEMVKLKSLAERKKPRIKIGKIADLEGDRVGKVGPWNLWMPTTRERSCEIAQYDPVTLEPKTSWCTTRMTRSNLFYSYIGSPGEDIILFYIIKDNPKGKEDWISLGFVDGEPALESDAGGLSLDRDGGGMSPKRFKSILGPYYDEILDLLSNVVKDLGGIHPARQKLKDAAQDPEVLKYLTRGLSRDEASEMKAMVLREPSVSPEILAAHLNDDNEKIQRAVAENPNTPQAALKRFSRSEDWLVRLSVAKNSSTPTEILVHLEEYDDMNWVRGAARSNLENRNLAESSLRKLISHLVR